MCKNRWLQPREDGHASAFWAGWTTPSAGQSAAVCPQTLSGPCSAWEELLLQLLEFKCCEMPNRKNNALPDEACINLQGKWQQDLPYSRARTFVRNVAPVRRRWFARKASRQQRLSVLSSLAELRHLHCSLWKLAVGKRSLVLCLLCVGVHKAVFVGVRWLSC